MNPTFFPFVVIALLFLTGRGDAADNWSPAYDEGQLETITRCLEKWKPEIKHTVIKDMFRGRNYEPDWNVVKADATPWDQVPDSFKSEWDARRAGCECDFIKSTEAKTCLLKLTASQGAWLFVYDRDAGGKYVKSGVITPPTWYEFASVTLVDIFRSGRPKFILIEHQGDHGTGRDEKIHWILGWDGHVFRTAFRETVLWCNRCLGDNVIYRMNYHLEKGKRPCIEARYSFAKVFITAYPYEFHSEWRDWLFWNEKTFSFYDARMEDEKIQNGSEFESEFEFRSNVERNRKRIMSLPPLPRKMWEGEAVEKYWSGVGSVSATNADGAVVEDVKTP